MVDGRIKGRQRHRQYMAVTMTRSIGMSSWRHHQETHEQHEHQHTKQNTRPKKILHRATRELLYHRSYPFQWGTSGWPSPTFLFTASTFPFVVVCFTFTFILHFLAIEHTPYIILG